MSSDQRKSLGLHVLQAEDTQGKMMSMVTNCTNYIIIITLSRLLRFSAFDVELLFKNDFISDRISVSPKKIFRCNVSFLKIIYFKQKFSRAARLSTETGSQPCDIINQKLVPGNFPS